MSMNINIEDEYERALFFSRNKLTVHVSRNNGLWHNGLITEVHEKLFVLLDRKDKKSYDILFSELKHPLVRYKEDKK